MIGTWKDKNVVQKFGNLHTFWIFKEPARPFGFTTSTAFSDDANREGSYPKGYQNLKITHNNIINK
jgi:hypothetical protein